MAKARKVKKIDYGVGGNTDFNFGASKSKFKVFKGVSQKSAARRERKKVTGGGS